MAWSLYQQEKRLEPLVFSNGKTQEDIVKEVIENIKNGQKVIFIRGMCGTGKSAIALNLAKEIGKASIVVPRKNLQKQYEEDYSEEKTVIKENGEKLKIKVITGRKNHNCPYLIDNEIKKASQTSLLKFNNIFEKEKKKEDDNSADNSELPCKIELRERNRDIIMNYLKNSSSWKRFKEEPVFIKDLRRSSIACVCPYWSPLLPSHMDIKLDERSREKYEGISNEYVVYSRKPGCSYYEQFLSYKNTDAIIFNSHKYNLEMSIGRKPKTEIDIIDECDEFLDSFSNQEEINLIKLQFSIDNLNLKSSLQAINIANQIKILIKDLIFESFQETSIQKIKDTKIERLLDFFRKESDFLSGVFEDEDSYCFKIYEIAKIFEDFEDETYISFRKNKEIAFINLVTTNLERRFKEMVEKNKTLVLMSGTLHSGEVLRDIFGINNFAIVEAENKHLGSVTEMRTGMEMDCKYENFKNGRITREQYLRALSKCVEIAPKPILVHITSFYDLPTQKEKENYKIDNLIPREELQRLQNESNLGVLVREFKEGKSDVLFSTRCTRGVDFPGKTCNSIIITKFPYPDAKSLFWEVLKKNFPTKYWEFYKDRARRELLQRVYRGLRYKDDHIYLLSPDIRVFSIRVA